MTAGLVDGGMAYTDAQGVVDWLSRAPEREPVIAIAATALRDALAA